MKNQNQKSNSEDMLDMAIKAAATRAFDEYNQSLEIPDEEIEFSEEHKRKMEKLFTDYHRKERARRIRRISSRAACVVVAVAVVSTAAMFGAGAWRFKFMNFIFDSEAPGTDISFNDNGGTTYSDEYIRLKYVPFGFEVVEQVKSSKCNVITFEQGEKYFNFSMEAIEGQKSIDTEGADVENVTVNKYDGVYSTKEDRNTLLWHDDFNVLIVSGNISKDEIIKIAEYTEVLENF